MRSSLRMEFFRATGIPPEASEWFGKYDDFVRSKIGTQYKWPIRLRDWELWKVAQFLPQARGPYRMLETGAFNTFLGLYLHELSEHLTISDLMEYHKTVSLLRAFRIYRRHPLKAPYGRWRAATKKGAPRAELRTVDLTDIPYDDDTFDFVTCVSIIEHIPDFPAAMAEMLRVLKPDGLLLVTTDVTPEVQPYRNGTKYLTIEEFREACHGATDLSEGETPDFSEENWRYGETFPVINAFVALQKVVDGSVKPRPAHLTSGRVKTLGGERRTVASPDAQ